MLVSSPNGDCDKQWPLHKSRVTSGQTLRLEQWENHGERLKSSFVLNWNAVQGSSNKQVLGEKEERKKKKVKSDIQIEGLWDAYCGGDQKK